jgi:hypothetical protein
MECVAIMSRRHPGWLVRSGGSRCSSKFRTGQNTVIALQLPCSCLILLKGGRRSGRRSGGHDSSTKLKERRGEEGGGGNPEGKEDQEPRAKITQ